MCTHSMTILLNAWLMSMRTALKGPQPIMAPRSLNSFILNLLFLLIIFGNLSACSFLSTEQVVYNEAGVRIGLESDPTVARSRQLVLNNHPRDLTPGEIASLLQPIQVSRSSVTITGLVTHPQPVPLFTPKELSAISEHLAKAFREVKPDERVYFSLQISNVTSRQERTVGSLFFRGPYLHVVVTDHSSIIRPDTGGSDPKDHRDTKGMQLSVVGPAQAATLSNLEEPRWAPFDKVHISLVAKEVFTRRETAPAAYTKQAGTDSSAPLPAATSPARAQGGSSPEELQRQMRELSETNQELKSRLEEQNNRMQQLQEQVEQIRREVPNSDVKGQLHTVAPVP